jgi:glycosyltransferase involved in cell wall biosynthesis
MKKLSVVLATRNEEKNIGACLESVAKIADEIVVIDEGSTDGTREIARKYGARVFKVKHEPIFHKTKQKALDRAAGEWVLQLDADERVTPALAEEIKKVVEMGDGAIKNRKIPKKKKRLFERHQRLVEKRDGKIGKGSGEVVAFFVPRLNYFLGRPLRYAGKYPDGVIRLVKKGKARFPAKSVHEQMSVDGEVVWLVNDLEHRDSPTLAHYFKRLNRYTDLHARELRGRKAPKNIFYLFYYSVIKANFVFWKLFIRNKGFMDGVRGFLWSAFSASHYPVAYFKYYTNGYNK